jgi:hypothetical protein
VFYNYRFFHKERWSIYLNLGDDENGNPIPKLRILIYLPLRGRDYALRGWVKPGEETGKPKKRGVVVHLAGGGFTMSVQVFLSSAPALTLPIALAYSYDLPFFAIQVPTGERRPPLSNPLRHPLLSRHLPRLRQSPTTPLPRRPEPMLRAHPLDSRPGRLVPVPLHLGYTVHQDLYTQRRSYSDSLVRR